MQHQHNTQLTREDAALAANYQPNDVSHKVLSESSTTTESLAQPGSASNITEECNDDEDDVDVVGLL